MAEPLAVGGDALPPAAAVVTEHRMLDHHPDAAAPAQPAVAGALAVVGDREAVGEVLGAHGVRDRIIAARADHRRRADRGGARGQGRGGRGARGLRRLRRAARRRHARLTRRRRRERATGAAWTRWSGTSAFSTEGPPARARRRDRPGGAGPVLPAYSAPTSGISREINIAARRIGYASHASGRRRRRSVGR